MVKKYLFSALEPTIGRWGLEWLSWLEKPEGGSSQQTFPGFNVNAAGVEQNRANICSKGLDKLIELHQINGPWPVGHPLPLPRWEDGPIKPYKLKSSLEYEALACEIEMHLQKLLEEHNYDTIGNFLEFYEKYQRTESENVLDFFHQ